MDATSLRFYMKSHPFKVVRPKKEGEQPTQFVTCPARVAFCYFDEGRDQGNGLAYDGCLILPPEADLSVPKTMYANAAQQKFGAGWASLGLKTPSKKQAVLKAKGYEGFSEDPNAIYLQVSSKFKPQVFDRNKNPIAASEIYSGCWVLALLRVYSYDNKTKGVGFGVVSLQKLADDARFESGDRSYAFDEISEHGASAGAIASGTAQAPEQNIPGF